MFIQISSKKTTIVKREMLKKNVEKNFIHIKKAQY